MNDRNKIIDFLMSVIFILPLAIFSAYTIQTLWNWFISDTFGLVRLGIAQAYGISLIHKWLISGISRYKGKEDDEEFFPLMNSMFKRFVSNCLVLLFGHICIQFIQ